MDKNNIFNLFFMLYNFWKSLVCLKKKLGLQVSNTVLSGCLKILKKQSGRIVKVRIEFGRIEFAVFWVKVHNELWRL